MIKDFVDALDTVQNSNLPATSKRAIQDVILQSLQEYFDDLDGQKPTDVYNMIMRTVEKPVLMAVMAHAKNNQSHAADMLGINRNTLRKKLLEHGLL